MHLNWSTGTKWLTGCLQKVLFLLQITVEKTDIDFDTVSFNETYTRDFTVANNCHLPVHFKFLDNNGKICENMIKVEPTEGELITGIYTYPFLLKTFTTYAALFIF